MRTEIVLPDVVIAREIGHSVARAARRDGLVRVRPGALVGVPDGAEPWERDRLVALARCVALQAQFTAEITFSHETAALLHGLWLPRSIDARTHVYQPYSANGRTHPDVARHSGRLPESDRTEVHGLPVTTLQRTVVDCARNLHPRDALAVVDSGLRIMARASRFHREGSVERISGLREELLERVRLVGPGRGVVQARAVIAVGDGLAESPGESGVRWIAVSAGLPSPDLQVPVRTRLGLFYVDGAWCGEGWMLCFEYDGVRKYGGSGSEAARAVTDEKQREDAIRDEGAAMLRFTARDLADVARTLARIRRLLPAEVVAAARPVPGLWRPW